MKVINYAHWTAFGAGKADSRTMQKVAVVQLLQILLVTKAQSPWRISVKSSIFRLQYMVIYCIPKNLDITLLERCLCVLLRFNAIRG